MGGVGHMSNRWVDVALLIVLCGMVKMGIRDVYFVEGGWRYHGRRD